MYNYITFSMNKEEKKQEKVVEIYLQIILANTLNTITKHITGMGVVGPTCGFCRKKCIPSHY